MDSTWGTQPQIAQWLPPHYPNNPHTCTCTQTHKWTLHELSWQAIVDLRTSSCLEHHILVVKYTLKHHHTLQRNHSQSEESLGWGTLSYFKKLPPPPSLQQPPPCWVSSHRHWGKTPHQNKDYDSLFLAQMSTALFFLSNKELNYSMLIFLDPSLFYS